MINLPCKKEKEKKWKEEREEKRNKVKKEEEKFWGSKRKTYNRKIKYKIRKEGDLRGKQRLKHKRLDLWEMCDKSGSIALPYIIN